MLCLDSGSNGGDKISDCQTIVNTVQDCDSYLGPSCFIVDDLSCLLRLILTLNDFSKVEKHALPLSSFEVEEVPQWLFHFVQADLCVSFLNNSFYLKK